MSPLFSGFEFDSDAFLWIRAPKVDKVSHLNEKPQRRSMLERKMVPLVSQSKIFRSDSRTYDNNSGTAAVSNSVVAKKCIHPRLVCTPSWWQPRDLFRSPQLVSPYHTFPYQEPRPCGNVPFSSRIESGKGCVNSAPWTDTRRPVRPLYATLHLVTRRR